jgi:hypothetical protein
MRSRIDLSAMCILETRMTSPDRCSQISSVSVPWASAPRAMASANAEARE